MSAGTIASWNGERGDLSCLEELNQSKSKRTQTQYLTYLLESAVLHWSPVQDNSSSDRTSCVPQV